MYVLLGTFCSERTCYRLDLHHQDGTSWQATSTDATTTYARLHETSAYGVTVATVAYRKEGKSVRS